MRNDPTRPRRFRSAANVLWGVPVVFVLVMVFVSFFSPVLGPQAPGRRTHCLNNVRNIGLALLNYASANHDHFPPAYFVDKHGRPIHSWRALILPYLDQAALARQYRWDEPWNGPHNAKFADVAIPGFHCPESGGPKTETNYMVVVGPKTVFPDSRSRTTDEIQRADGTSNTLLLVEVANSGVNWLEPRDIKYEDAIRGINQAGIVGISSRHKGFVCVCFADGRGIPLDVNTKPEMLQQLLQIDDGGPVNPP
jgi:hypothetical protein